MINDLVETLNSVSVHWLIWCASGLIDSCLLLGIVGLIWLGIRKRVSPQVGYCLFLLVLLKPIASLNVSVPQSVAEWAPSTRVLARLQQSFHAQSPSGTASVDQSNERQATNDDTAPVTLTSANIQPDLTTQVLSEAAQAETVRPAVPSHLIPSRKAPIASAATHYPSLLTWGMLGWVGCVVFLLGKLARQQFRFEKRLKQLPLSESTGLEFELQELCRRVNISRKVRIVLSDQVTIPAVCGCRSPVILLPKGIESTLSKDQLEWLLLHELAHIQRHDVWAVAFQRLVGVLYFFNPAVWIANRIIDQLREFACDDLAALVSHGSSVDFGQAFLKVLQQANDRDLQISGALGVFGFDSRAACFDRVRRLLDDDRMISTTLDRYSVIGLLLLACVVLPRLNAADVGEKQKPSAVAKKADKPTEAIALAKDTGEFDLQIVGPDQKPIPGASVVFTTKPLPIAEQVRVGQFDRKLNSYEVQVTADSKGRVVLAMPSKPANFVVRIEVAGYGPYLTRWSSEDPPQQIPAKFVVELEEGWNVGGIVVDSDGRPVEGVDVHPSIEFKRRKDDPSELHSGRSVKTNAEGKWLFEGVPASKDVVVVELNHPLFLTKIATVHRSDVELKQAQQPTAQIAIGRGVTVVGKIVDDQGQPIEGARIFTKHLNALRETYSGQDGSYKLEGCTPAMSRIVVSAKGKAMDLQQVRIGPEMQPVNFAMQPGGKIRVRVLDDNGNPAPKARIFFQRWRGDIFGYFEFDKVNQYTDEDGVWEWDEAPLDDFKADICAPDCMQLSKQTLRAREEEYVFQAPSRMVVAGKVIDAETKEPIKTFDLLPGFHNENDHLSWHNGGRFTAKDGEYRYYPEHGRVAYVFRIEAFGYRAYMSRDIQLNEGKVSIDIELQKAKDLAATILCPDGSPATEAKIAVGIPGAQISILNGDIDKSSTYCGVQTADATGMFRVVAQANPIWLVIVHPTGFFHRRLLPDEPIPSQIELTAWGQVEGVYNVAGKPVSQITLDIGQVGPDAYGQEGPRIFTQIKTVTDGEGRYRFDRVYPGEGRIGREIVMMVGEGATDFTSTCQLPVTIKPGETAETDFGEFGRPVIGKFQSSNPDVKLDWKQYLVQMEPLLPELPELDFPNIPAEVANKPDERKKWLDDWQKTESGKAWLSLKAAHQAREKLKASQPYYRATLNTKGEFRFEDVQAGDYTIYRLFSRTRQKLTVPSMADGRSDEPLDVGVMQFTQ